MKNIEAGLGDVLLRYPELINGPAPQDEAFLKTLPDYFIAVHPFTSTPNKAFPNPDVLFDWLRRDGVPFVVLGNEPLYLAPCAIRVPGRLPLSFEVLRRARKFVGTLSSFNCAAQLMMKPSYVIVNRSIKESFVYGLMADNNAVVKAWNEIGGKQSDIRAIYHDVVEWALEP